jgi:acetyltransferase-like isoleucine patch superfamily enzyme
MEAATVIKRLLTPLQIVVSLAMFLELAAVTGLALWPPVMGWLMAYRHLGSDSPMAILLLCMLAALGYFAFGLSLIVVVPIARWLTLAIGTPAGKYPYVSWRGYQWASYNALTLLVRFSFINWIRATPFIVMYHRLMGMRVGARVQINTAVVADQNLIVIGDDTVIGGDVTLIGHSVEGANIVAAPVTIGSRVTVGLMAVILPGCQIGDGAIVAANAVLKKGTVVGPGEIWGGVPARYVGRRSDPKGDRPE